MVFTIATTSHPSLRSNSPSLTPPWVITFCLPSLRTNRLHPTPPWELMVCSPPPFNGPKNGPKISQVHILPYAQTKELITDTRNRDQVFLTTPLLFSNLPAPLPINSCVKTYGTCEVELWWLLFPSAKCRSPVFTMQFRFRMAKKWRNAAAQR